MRLNALAAVGVICLALTPIFGLEPFNPSEANSWAFPRDCADPAASSPIDLRRLNEKFAGEHGFIRLSDDGNGFVRGDGKAIRFFGTHMGHGLRYGRADRPTSDQWSVADYERHARWLARLGVNGVRIGSRTVHDPAADAPPERMDEVAVESIFRRIAAARKAGIYCQVSPVWFHDVKDLGPKLKIEGYEDGKTALTKLLYFHPEVQRVYKAWIRQLYTTPNPHTGLTIAEDPAVLAIEVCNEDSLWWFPTDKLQGAPRRMLQEAFGQWAAKKYGSCEKAIEAWADHREDEDAPSENRLALVIMWHLTRAGEATHQIPRPRLDDQAAFLIDIQRKFHREMKRYITEELGCRQLVSGSNFRSVDLVTTEDALRLGWQDMDLICKNSYFTAGGTSDVEGYRLDAGDVMGFKSAVTHPLELPIRMRQVEGKPFIITETLWNRMHPFETEGPIVAAAYQALVGLDGIWFAGPRGVTWTADPYYRFWTHKDAHPMKVFDNAQPGGMGQFPAAALLARAVGLEPAPTVVLERRTRDQIVTRQLPLTAEAGYHDFVHTDEGAMAESGEAGNIPGSAFLVGRVAVEYVNEPAPNQVTDISPYVSDDAIRSATGEVRMDLKRRLFIVDAPKAQVVSGYVAQAGPVELTHAKITCGNEHASVSVIALDDQPLPTSRSVLVQVGLPARPTSWRETPTLIRKDNDKPQPGLLIEDTGDMPWRVQNADLVIELSNKAITTARQLDGNGIPMRELPIERTPESVRLRCPPNTMYVVLEGKGQ